MIFRKINTDVIIIFFCVTFQILIVPLFEITNDSTTIFIPLTFLYFAMKYPINEIFNFKHVKIFLVFLVWTSLVSLVAEYDLYQAILIQKKLLGVFLFALIHVMFVYFNPDRITYIYKLYAFLLVVLIFKVLIIGNQQDYTIDNRLMEEGLNANGYGYFALNGVFSIFMLFTRRRLANFLLLFAIIAGSFYLILLSASRGGMIIFLFSTCFYLLIYFSINKFNVLKMFRMIGFALIITFLTVNIVNFVLENSYLGTRYEMLIENKVDDMRILHIKNGFKIGMENFFAGVGGGNYALVPNNFEPGSFSHNSYIESFANYGIFGFLILVYLYFDFIKSLLVKLAVTNSKSKESLYFILVFVISFVLYNIFYVTYLSIIFMGLFFAVRTHLSVWDNE